jgi:hypothetical protein
MDTNAIALGEHWQGAGVGEIIGTFGFRSCKDTDKFASIPFEWYGINKQGQFIKAI